LLDEVRNLVDTPSALAATNGMERKSTVAAADDSASEEPVAPEQAGGVFQRSFAMLEVIVRSSTPLAATEIAEMLGIPKPTAYRMIEGFERQGLVRRQFGSKRVTVGPRLTDLAFDILRASVQYAPRRMILEGLVRSVGETCNIGTLDASEVVYLDRVEAKHWPLQLQFGIGSRVPVHCTAIGKLFLAFLPPRQRRELLGGLDLRPMTSATLTDKAVLQGELAAIRERGLSIDAEEYIVGVVCVAAPIFNTAGQIRAGIAVQAPSARMSPDQALELRDELIAAAGQLSASFEFG
jgi:IclR family acetate operon transcriptional repressor